MHRVWRERREAGGLGVMVVDRTGHAARSFGFLDTADYLTYLAGPLTMGMEFPPLPEGDATISTNE